MKKYFKTNNDYFKFINKNKDIIKVISLSFVKRRKRNIINYKYCLKYDYII